MQKLKAKQNSAGLAPRLKRGRKKETCLQPAAAWFIRYELGFLLLAPMAQVPQDENHVQARAKNCFGKLQAWTLSMHLCAQDVSLHSFQGTPPHPGKGPLFALVQLLQIRRCSSFCGVSGYLSLKVRNSKASCQKLGLWTAHETS